VNNPLRLSLLGIVLLVGLRMAIGWQLLYEGLWKINTLDSPRPWSAEGYLKNSQGPARSFFRELSGDPSDFSWLDYGVVTARWDIWHDRFVAHYALDKGQQKKLDEILNGYRDFRAELIELPDGLTVEELNRALKSVKFVPETNRLIADGEMRITPREKVKLLSLATGDDEKTKAYRQAVETLYARATRNLSVKERLLALLEGDPERAGLVQKNYEGTVDGRRLGSLELFKQASARYESGLAEARQQYNYRHLEHDFQELQAQKLQAIGPVKALEKELKDNAARLLTETQLTMPPVSLPWSRMDWIDFQTISGLTVLGLLLIGGLFTRTAAFLAAGMLFMFYLAMPPLPGLPAPAGPEHSYIINKNLIEVFALLAIAALPTGQWFGLDSVISWLRGDAERTGDSNGTGTADASFPSLASVSGADSAGCSVDGASPAPDSPAEPPGGG